MNHVRDPKQYNFQALSYLITIISFQVQLNQPTKQAEKTKWITVIENKNLPTFHCINLERCGAHAGPLWFNLTLSRNISGYVYKNLFEQCFASYLHSLALYYHYQFVNMWVITNVYNFSTLLSLFSTMLFLTIRLAHL